MPSPTRTAHLQETYEPHQDPQALTSSNNKSDSPKNVTKDIDYAPNPAKSLPVSPEHSKIVTSITNLYSGSASEDDMQVYAHEAVYDDRWSFCDTRYKIAGQWYGIPKIFSTSCTLGTQIVEDTSTSIVFKLRQEYTPRLVHVGKAVDSLISLTLDDAGKVRYHKDMWNEKDYSHEGLGRVMKEVNGDWLTKVTRPPGYL